MTTAMTNKTLDTLRELRDFYAGRVERNRHSIDVEYPRIIQAQQRKVFIEVEEYERACKDIVGIQRFVDALDEAIETMEWKSEFF